MKVSYLYGDKVYEAEVIATRGVGVVDLLVQGISHEGEFPFRVNCVPCEVYDEEILVKRGDGEKEQPATRSMKRKADGGIWRAKP
jgi:hypothetical protein